MKLKQIVSAILIPAVLLFATACGNNNGNDDPKCECTKGAAHTGECDPACPNGKGNAPCTHTDPVCTCDPKHHNTPCTCGDPDCECTIPKTYAITLRDGAVTITVKYKALPNAEVPAYMNQLTTRFNAYNNDPGNETFINLLVSNGGEYTLVVEYADDVEVYSNLKSGTPVSKTIYVHNDWISTATGNLPSLSNINLALNSLIANVIMMNNMIRMA